MFALGVKGWCGNESIKSSEELRQVFVAFDAANGIDPQRAVELEVVEQLARPADGKFKRVVQANESSARKAS